MANIAQIIEIVTQALEETDEGKKHLDLMRQLENPSDSDLNNVLLAYKAMLQDRITTNVINTNLNQDWIPQIDNQFDRQLIADSLMYNGIQTYLITNSRMEHMHACNGWLNKHRLMLGKIKVECVDL